MQFTRSVTDLAAGIFKVWGHLRAHKTAGLSVSCCVTEIAFFEFTYGEAFFHPFDAFERPALF